jgi:hypothetical protein
MFVPQAFVAALFMTILSTICWGSWANTYKVTENYRVELFYWDFAAGIFLISLALALTMGSTPGGDNSFLANLHAAAPANLFYAALGGFIFNIANFLLIAGIGMVGLAIAFPISIGIALVEGVVLSYLIQPKGSPGLLGLGVGMGAGRGNPDRQGLWRVKGQGQPCGVAQGRHDLHRFWIPDGHVCAVHYARDDGFPCSHALHCGRFFHIRSVPLLLRVQSLFDEESARW